MQVETLILGAGAAGLFCAARAGRGVVVVDHARAPGEKIRISGGGRCNITNLHSRPEAFLSANRHFAKSALARFTPDDFIALLDAAGIAWHEKTLGQLFCDGSARQVVTMLTEAVAAAGADLWLSTEVLQVRRQGAGFAVTLRREGQDIAVTARRLVLATGGRSIPKMGASGLAYDLAGQFGLQVLAPRPALVPLTFPEGRFAALAGVALPVVARAGTARFAEAALFTHRGLSGPAILQISTYWAPGEEITLDLLAGAAPDLSALPGGRSVAGALAALMPARLAEFLAAEWGVSGQLADLPGPERQRLTGLLSGWRLRPAGTEGWRTAEVSAGGIATSGIDAKTMEAKMVPGLHIIGEAVDVTGWLGGYNFQWAWASAAAAGAHLQTTAR